MGTSWMECHTLTTSFIVTTAHVPQLSIHLQVSIILNVSYFSISHQLQLSKRPNNFSFMPAKIKTHTFLWNSQFSFQQMLIVYFKYYHIFLASGNLSCMYSVMSGAGTYLTVYNLDTTTDEISTYRFLCYVSCVTARKRPLSRTQCPTGFIYFLCYILSRLLPAAMIRYTSHITPRFAKLTRPLPMWRHQVSLPILWIDVSRKMKHKMTLLRLSKYCVSNANCIKCKTTHIKNIVKIS